MTGPSPSTRHSALAMVAYCIAGLRVATLAQMLPSLPVALDQAERPLLTAATWGLAVAALCTGAGLALRHRRPPGARWAVVDVSLAVLVLGAGLLTVPVDSRTGTWEGFQLGYALAVACTLGGVHDRRLVGALVLAVATAEVLYLAPALHGLADVPRLLGNLLTVLVLGPLAWFGFRSLVRLGADADEARRYAASMAKAEEERRARVAIHNGTALMRLLLEHPAEDGAHAPLHLRRQAEAEINRMRAYLARADSPAAERGPKEATDLADLVGTVADEFTDLPITVVADLARGVRLQPGTAEDLAAALRSLLLNVREHAGADRVVVHADGGPPHDGWSVTVHDNGRGFDTDVTPYGVGLGDLVVGQLARHGVSARIESVPGVGTTGTLTLQPVEQPT